MNAAVASAFKAGGFIANRLPGPVLNAATGVGGALATRAMRDRRSMVELHQRRALGVDASDAEVARSVDATFQSYARYWRDALILSSLSPEKLNRDVTIDGLEYITTACRSGIGPILALPHLGPWERAAAWLSRCCELPVAAVVEQLESDEVFEWFLDFRRSIGINVIPLGPDAALQVGAAILNGEIMCLLCDRDLTGGGVEVELLGERTTIPAGPAVLAIKTGAPLLACAVYEQGQGFHATIRPPIEIHANESTRAEVQRISQVLADSVTELVRQSPSEWHLMQPNWPSDPGYVAPNSG